MRKPLVLSYLIPVGLLSLGLGGCDNSETSKTLKVTRDVAEVPVPVVDAGCPHQQAGSCPHPESAAVAGDDRPANDAKSQLYGAPLQSQERVALSSLLEHPERYHGKEIRVSGVVRRACSRRGCWMEITPQDNDDSRDDGESSAAGCRVTFKDYGFLVPTDSAGAVAEMDALVQVTQVKPEAVSHYESEGARFPNKTADGGAREVRLVASGVRLSRGNDG